MNRAGSIHRVLIGVPLMILLSLVFSRALWDIDFWWHLATGRWIVHNGFLKGDPFSLTGSLFPEPYRLAILIRYWLCHILYYWIWRITGLWGLVIFRSLFLTFIVVVIFLLVRKRTLNNEIAIFWAALTAWTMHYFSGLRPQLWSIFFVPLLIYFLSVSVSNDSPKAISIGIIGIILLWANLHPGVILAGVLIAFYLFYVIVSKRQISDKKRLILVLTLALILTGMSPVGFKSYISLLKFEGGLLQARTSEYQGLLFYIKRGFIVVPYIVAVFVWIFVFVTNFKQYSFIERTIMILLFVISIRAFRYIPYFVTGISILAFTPQQKILKRFRYGFLILAVVSFIGLLHSAFPLTKTLRNGPVDTNRFPVKAVDFVLSKKPAGNIFNHFNWGGYLIWRLYPRYKVFIDSRTISIQGFRDYTHLLWDLNKIPLLLHKYNIKTIIIPRTNPFTGEKYPLVQFLFFSDRWKLIYNDTVALVFTYNKEFSNTQLSNNGSNFVVNKSQDLCWLTTCKTKLLLDVSGLSVF